MGEALWSAVACYRFRSGQLAGLRAVSGSLESEAASKLAESKAAARLGGPHSRAMRRLNPVFSTEGSPIFKAAKDLLLFVFNKKQQMLRCAQHDRCLFSAAC
jgi:hypothetical protein